MKKIYTRKERIIGFTLAEVLITLTIIGVIAALTIPSLIQNIQDAQYRAAWKKDYSDITGAFKRVAIDNSGNLADAFTSADTFRDKALAYMSYTQKCNVGSALGPNGCWHDANSWYNLSGAVYNGDDKTQYSRVILNNGTLILFGLSDAQCQNGNSIHHDMCGVMDFDVNGFKGPNIIGKDIFAAYVSKDGTVSPLGIQGDYYYNLPGTYSCNISAYPSSRGWNCSADYLKQ